MFLFSSVEISFNIFNITPGAVHTIDSANDVGFVFFFSVEGLSLGDGNFCVRSGLFVTRMWCR